MKKIIHIHYHIYKPVINNRIITLYEWSEFAAKAFIFGATLYTVATIASEQQDKYINANDTIQEYKTKEIIINNTDKIKKEAIQSYKEENKMQ